MILLNSIPAEYFVVKNALQYTGIVPKIELIVSGLKVRELELNANRKTGNNLYAKGKTERKKSFNDFDHSGSSSFKNKHKDKA